MIEKLQVKSEHEIETEKRKKDIKTKAVDRKSTKIADLIKRIEVLEELNGIV